MFRDFFRFTLVFTCFFLIDLKDNIWTYTYDIITLTSPGDATRAVWMQHYGGF